MTIYFSSQVKRLVKKAWTEGFLQGVKYQKGRGPQPKRIEIRYVD